MAFQHSWDRQPAPAGVDGQVVVLHDSEGNRLEVWPALGFNAYRWRVPADTAHELLYSTPQLLADGRGTRFGFPVLFPFPNRIAAGRFSWEGRSYQLPLGDPAKANAIHGFAFKNPWRVLDVGADDVSAWVTAEFRAAIDAPDVQELWPADGVLRLTYQLRHRRLRVAAEIENAGAEPLPFGLGFHPYFGLAPFGGEQALIWAAAQKSWELRASLPTGRTHPVDGPLDLREVRTLAGQTYDDVLTELRPAPFEEGTGLGLVARLRDPKGERALSLWTADDFRDLVIFTPPHRQALCLEPYTCITDAINLQQRGIAAGLRVLAPGARWHGAIELTFDTREESGVPARREPGGRGAAARQARRAPEPPPAAPPERQAGELTESGMRDRSEGDDGTTADQK